MCVILRSLYVCSLKCKQMKLHFDIVSKDDRIRYPSRAMDGLEKDILIGRRINLRINSNDIERCSKEPFRFFCRRESFFLSLSLSLSFNIKVKYLFKTYFRSWILILEFAISKSIVLGWLINNLIFLGPFSAGALILSECTLTGCENAIDIISCSSSSLCRYPLSVFRHWRNVW